MTCFKLCLLETEVIGCKNSWWCWDLWKSVAEGEALTTGSVWSHWGKTGSKMRGDETMTDRERHKKALLQRCCLPLSQRAQHVFKEQVTGCLRDSQSQTQGRSLAQILYPPSESCPQSLGVCFQSYCHSLLALVFFHSFFLFQKLLTGTVWQAARGPAVMASLTGLSHWLIKHDRRPATRVWKFLALIVLRVWHTNEWGLMTAQLLECLLFPQSGWLFCFEYISESSTEFSAGSGAMGPERFF